MLGSLSLTFGASNSMLGASAKIFSTPFIVASSLIFVGSFILVRTSLHCIINSELIRTFFHCNYVPFHNVFSVGDSKNAFWGIMLPVEGGEI